MLREKKLNEVSYLQKSRGLYHMNDMYVSLGSPLSDREFWSFELDESRFTSPYRAVVMAPARFKDR